ncbi:MAG: amidohydrolase family protein [Actinomycetota bacterium]|nr:amidohydrolase family protein [Actinomycetota bacterium]
MEEQRRLLEVARGEHPADLFVRGGAIANVYSGELLEGNVAVVDGHIAYVGKSEHAISSRTEVIDAGGMIVAPGYIDAHYHPWVLYNPVTVAEGILPLGTTTLVADNLFFYMQMGPERFAALADALKELPLTYLWVARLISQAVFPGEDEMFSLDKIKDLLKRDDVVGTAEITRWPALAAGDPALLAGISATKVEGKLADGHTGGASEARLGEVVAAGIDADHEAITKGEVLNRLRLGLWTMLRGSSLRRDLPELLRVVTEDGVSSHRLIMTTDGPAPEYIAEQGLLDGLLRTAVACGVPPMQALQMVTINPATFLRLDHRLGGIAVGRRADILLLPNLASFCPETVIARGGVVAEKGKLVTPLPTIDWDDYRSRPRFSDHLKLADPGLYPLRGSGSSIDLPVIHLRSTVITAARNIQARVKEGWVDLEDQEGILHAALIDREGAWISRSLVSGFAGDLDALASTYNTTTQLLVLGKRPEAMAQAAQRVRELDGGIVVVQAGKVVYELPLPISGMMANLPFNEVARRNEHLSSKVADAGYEFHDILYTLLFLTCDFLPALRLMPLGLLDVKTARVLIPAETPTTSRP